MNTGSMDCVLYNYVPVNIIAMSYNPLSAYIWYVTDSPLSVTNIAELAMFYLNLSVLMIIPWSS